MLRDRRKCTNGHILLHSHSCLHRLLSQSVVNHSLGASCVWSSTPPQIIIYGPAPGTWSNTPEMVCILLLFSPSSCCFDHQTPVGVVSSEQLLVRTSPAESVVWWWCVKFGSISCRCVCLSGRLLYQWQWLLVVWSGKRGAVSCCHIILSDSDHLSTTPLAGSLDHFQFSAIPSPLSLCSIVLMMLRQ